MRTRSAEAPGLGKGRSRGSGSMFRRLVTLGVLVATGFAGGWAGRTVLESSAPPSDYRVEPVLTEVQYGSVGRTLTFMATVEQPFEMVAINSLSGIVTWVGSGGMTESGDRLFEVSGYPVFAARGETPFYRDLRLGVRGPDVEQLQLALNKWGHEVSVTGRFDAATTAAVRAWQLATSQPRTGNVAQGTILALPTLPTVVRFGDQIQHAALVNGGEVALLARHGEPEFLLNLPPERAALVPVDAQIEITVDGDLWTAVISDSLVDTFGQVTFRLTAPDGGVVCGARCEALGDAEHISLPAVIYVVPPTSGPSLPVSAIATRPCGAAVIQDPDGTTVLVTVLASSDGVAVIDGLELGRQVRLFPAGAGAGAVGDEAS